MGLLSLFQSKSAPPSAAPAEGRAIPAIERWRKGDFTFFPAGEEQHLVAVRGRQPLSLPSFAVDFLLHCDEFETMESHLARQVERHDWGALQLEALTSWLPKMTAAGLLVSAEQIRARCAAMVDPENRPPPIALVGFPTGGARSAMLERCLRSFGANLRENGRTAEMLVADSSARAEDQADFRALLGRLKREHGLPLRYAGEPEKRRFAEALVARSGCRPSSVEFALFDPLGAGFTCGANRNAILLHEAGRMAVSVDDDVICEIAPAPKAGARVALFALHDPFHHDFFADRASALAAAPFKSIDFLQTHETLLGRDLGALFPPDLRAEEIDLSCADDHILRRLGDAPVRLRTTFFGQVGDAGTPTSCYYFYAREKTRERLTADEAVYRAAFRSRSMSVVAPQPSIGAAWLSPGLTIGLDHRELLPPFFPVLHAEDTVFATATWLCCPHSAAGHLPFALHHDSGPDKRVHSPEDLSAETRATVFEFATVVRAILVASAPPEQATTADRLRTLGRNLVAFANQPASEFREAFRAVVLRLEADKLSYLEERLRAETEAPDFWRHDLERFIAHSRMALEHDDFDIPFELKSQRSDEANRRLMQQLLASYGALLEDWPEIVSAARALREEGGVFSREVSTAD